MSKSSFTGLGGRTGRALAVLALGLFVALGLSALPSGGSLAQSDGRVLRDVEYGANPMQTMDIYLPPKLDDPPAILMLHGGAWMVGDKTVDDVVANKTRHWLDRGYVFISVNTRLMPEADPLEQAEDLAAALAAAQSMAGSWGGDPGRFVLMGHSSGGHLAALLAADPDIASRNGAVPWLGTVVLDGGYDISELMGRKHMAFYDKVFGDDPEFWRDASPLHRLADPPAPMLLVCSSLSATACPRAEAFADRVGDLGGRATVLPEALSHSAINADLGLAGKYTDSVDMFLASVGLL
ncbi:alpha/beta hydrolase [Microbaculum marinum]|uniref:Alpha/beta hydrolase n=1 Tax=Microbaculum marinum TaxID=1764581 RepID=A0AAW9RM40_9HYPH